MTAHIITKEYRQLKGFSTDSAFKRPTFQAETSVNVQRLPDGTFAPRRGYQVQTAKIGGLGTALFQNQIDDELQQICIHSDGNLYKKRKGTLTIAFAGLNNYEYCAYEIYVDPLVSSDNQFYRFDPYSVIAQSALVTDSINFRFGKVSSFTGVAIGAAAVTYIGNLGGGPIQPGSIIMTDGTLTVFDDPQKSVGNGSFIGDTGIGPNSIDYATGNYSVTFSGITGAVTASYRSQLIVQFNQPLGKGYGIVSPFTVAQLGTMLNSVPDVFVMAAGDITIPAAFIEVTEQTLIPNNSAAILEFYYWESCNRTLAVTFPGLLASLDTNDFRNATFAAFQNVIYIANAFDPVKKYDGQTVYNAGMPIGNKPTVTNVGAGAVDIGDHNYYISYEQINATGRLVEGILSIAAPINIAGAASEIKVTITNLLQGSGWNTDCAIISAVYGPGNTIPVTAPHTMRPGDTAFFIDTAGVPQTRRVLSVTATSIDINGAPVTVTNATAWQKVISNDLRIRIYRTKATGTEPFFVFEIPNNSYATTTDYLDNVADSTLSFQYLFPTDPHYPPPQVGVCFAFKNIMIYTADPVNDDYVWFSDANFPEYVNQAFTENSEPNRFVLDSSSDAVVGVGVAGSTLVIFKNFSIYAVSGDITTGQFTSIAVSQGSNIGCVAHATILSVGGMLYFLHTNGLYCMSESNIYPTDQLGNPIPLTIPIDKFFRFQDSQQENQQFQLTRAVAVNYRKDNQYILFLPCENQSTLQLTLPRAANDYSRILCYDYQGKNWFEWTNINAAGGFIVDGDDLIWQERRLATTGDSIEVEANTIKQHRKYLLIDQADHVTSIRTTWVSSWEDLQQPRVRKKFVRAALLFDNISAQFLSEYIVSPILIDFNINFVAGNNIVVTIDAIAQPTVAFITNQAKTMTALAIQIRANANIDSVIILGTRQLYVKFKFGKINVINSVITTGGATQPIATISGNNSQNLPQMFFFTCKDWNSGIVDTEAIVTTAVEGNPWSVSEWSWTTWSGYEDTFLTVPLKNGTVTKSLQVGLQLNQLNTSFNLQGFQLEVAPDFRRTIVR